jgi:hypothetical protein
MGGLPGPVDTVASIDGKGSRMTTARELEMPPGWAVPGRIRTFATAAMIVAFALLMIALGVGGLGNEDQDVQVFALVYILFSVGLLGGARVIVRRAVRTSSVRAVDLRKDDDGTAVLCVRQTRAVQLITALTLLCAGGSFALLGARLLVDGGLLLGPLFLLCGLFLVGLQLAAVARGAPPVEVRLGPHRVRVQTGDRWLSARWDDVAAVYAYETRHQRLITISASGVERRAGRFTWATRAQRRRDAERIEIDTQHFAVDPVLLFHLLDFYHSHPLARVELGTAASLRRVREARFTAP